MENNLFIQKFYFTYSFFNENTINSELYKSHIIPILKKLDCKAVVQVRANMVLNNLFKKSGWHKDHHFNCNTAILYLNNCNGGTELKVGNKIKFMFFIRVFIPFGFKHFTLGFYFIKN